MGGHTVNRDVGYGVHSYINLKILGGHVPVCPPYEYGPETLELSNEVLYDPKSQGVSKIRQVNVENV